MSLKVPEVEEVDQGNDSTVNALGSPYQRATGTIDPIVIYTPKQATTLTINSISINAT